MSAFEITPGPWLDLKRPCQAVRELVFVVEQNVDPSEEWDDMDQACVHFVARDRTGNAIGTARLLPDGHIGRMAVIKAWRGQGVGDALLKAAVASALEAGHHELALNAQTHALGFYARFGFAATGEPFDEAGIPHRRMTLSI